MQTKWKTFFLAISYLLIAGGIQLMMGMGLAVVIQHYRSMTGDFGNEAMVGENVMKGVPYVLIASSVLTIFLFYMVYRGQRKSFSEEILLKPMIYRFSIIAAGIGLSAWCVNFSIISGVQKAGMFKKIFEVFADETGGGLYDNPILLLILGIGIIAPVCEEVVFRGVIYQTLNKSFSTGVTIVIQAVLFGIFHINPIQIVYATVLGVLLGYIVYRTQSLWPAIIIHIANNVIAVIIVKLVGEDATWITIGSVYIIGIIGMLLFMQLIVKRTSGPYKEILENNLIVEG